MRYLPLTSDDRRAMLSAIGVADIDALYENVPMEARRSGVVDLPLAQSEMAVERAMNAFAARNVTAGSVPFFIGAGAYRHHVPASVDHLIQRSEFLTTYTPYQPEIAQGTLQSLFEFQTQVSELLAMEVANSSMYDGSTGLAEAMLMACRVTRRNKVIFSGGVHPHYLETAKTLARTAGLELVACAPAIDAESAVLDHLDAATACVIVQSPNVFGTLSNLSPIAAAAQAKGALLVASFTEAMAFGLVEPPGAMGADIVAGEGQSFGNALNFGGPYVGLFATREKYMRQMPGRLAGETIDADGRRGFVLTLSTREQHIRRDKATSNICTNSGLCALAWTIHMTLLGAKGLAATAQINHERALETADALKGLAGVELLTPRFFNEFALRLAKPARGVVQAMADRGVLGGVAYNRLAPHAGLKDVLIVTATELTTDEDIGALRGALAEALA